MNSNGQSVVFDDAKIVGLWYAELLRHSILESDDMESANLAAQLAIEACPEPPAGWEQRFAIEDAKGNFHGEKDGQFVDKLKEEK